MARMETESLHREAKSSLRLDELETPKCKRTRQRTGPHLLWMKGGSKLKDQLGASMRLAREVDE